MHRSRQQTQQGDAMHPAGGYAGADKIMDRGGKMAHFTKWAASAALLVMGGCGSAPESPVQNACDRACLGSMLDDYLAAVVAHDPAQAPLVVGFRQTE